MIRLEKIGFLTASEAAEYMGVHRVKFYEWKNKGLLPEPVLEQPAITIWRLSDIKKSLKQRGGLPYNGNRQNRGEGA